MKFAANNIICGQRDGCKICTLGLNEKCLTAGPKLHLPGHQCEQKFSSGNKNFITGRQPATCKAGCHCKLSRSEKMIKN